MFKGKDEDPEILIGWNIELKFNLSKLEVVKFKLN
jgi:hypothetical protein